MSMTYRDDGSASTPAIYLGASQDLTVTATATNTAALTTDPHVLVQVVSTVDCRIAIGVNATATATSTLLPAMVPMVFGVPRGGRVSAIRVSSDGILNITTAL